VQEEEPVVARGAERFRPARQKMITGPRRGVSANPARTATIHVPMSKCAGWETVALPPNGRSHRPHVDVRMLWEEVGK